MPRFARLFAIVSLGAALLAPASAPLAARAAPPASAPPPARGAVPAADAQRPELAYLKQVNRWRPPADPQLLFLLMAQFANAGRHAEGVAFFDELLARFGPDLDARQKALYVAALAALRAGHAKDVALFARIGWVRDTVKLLDEAQRLAGDDVFVVRWMSGVVRAQLPDFFGERERAIEDLRWCEMHAERAPHPGWLREVYFQLAAKLRRSDAEAARRYQARSGFDEASKPAIFTTAFSVDPDAGHAFSSRAVREVVPGTVYALSGFEFTEYYFVVSADRRELIAIDAGTRPDSARAAHEALRERVPSLPPLTTVLVTHAHWDHVGGQRYFRGLEPAPRFIGRANYGGELAHDAMTDPALLRRFFGAQFSLKDVLDYRPDVTIDSPTELTIGGTRFALLPTRGGETDDALLVHLPQHGVLFAGDVLMPYIGAPFVEEGSVDGMLAAIEQIGALQPRLLLHGHEPLTRLFSSVALLADLQGRIAWLRDEVLRQMRAGAERGAIHAANPMPPGLERSDSGVHLAYLVLRGNVIDRLFDQHSGYWQNGLHGLDALTDADRGDALLHYLGVSDSRLAKAAESMVADGRHELAAALLRWTEPRVAGNARLQAARKLAYLKLMEKAQDIDPFRFIVYAAQIERAAPQLDAPAASGAPAR